MINLIASNFYQVRTEVFSFTILQHVFQMAHSNLQHLIPLVVGVLKCLVLEQSHNISINMNVARMSYCFNEPNLSPTNEINKNIQDENQSYTIQSIMKRRSNIIQYNNWIGKFTMKESVNHQIMHSIPYEWFESWTWIDKIFPLFQLSGWSGENHLQLLLRRRWCELL